MSAQGQSKDEQFLRRFFDFIENTTVDDIRRWVKNINRRLSRRTKWFIVSGIAAAIAMWAFTNLTIVAVEAIRWANRPTPLERLNTPYGLEERSVPALDWQQYTLLPGQFGTYYHYESNVPAGDLTACIAGVTPVDWQARRHIEVADTCGLGLTPLYTEWGTYLNGAVSQEIRDAQEALNTAIEAQQNAVVTDEVAPTEAATEEAAAQDPVAEATAQLEALLANYQQVEVALAQFESESDALTAIRFLFDRADDMGNVGNFVLLEERSVNYFYAHTASGITFTWTNGPWLYTVMAPNFDTMESAVTAFPY